MFRTNSIWVTLLVVALTACGGVSTGDGATSPREDASTNNETAVANDVPISQPDVQATPDAGPATPDAQIVADAAVQDSAVAEDRPASPPDSSVMLMPFSSATCARLRTMCWRLPGAETCEPIPCRMLPGGIAEATVPDTLASAMGYPRAQCSGQSCRLQTILGMPSDCYWRELGDTMSRFRCTCPGRTDIIVEAD